MLVLPNLLSTQPESEPGAAMDAAEGELESAPAPVESPTDPSADRQAFQPFEGATATTQAPESEAADARILETAGTATDEPSSFDFDDEQITAAIECALGEGKTVRWRTEVAKGFAVPSVPTMANGIECRNLYIQAEADGQEVATPVRSYCLKGERWELQGS